MTLDQLKVMAVALGYRFDVEADGTERLIRPDGSIAVIAKKAKESADRPPHGDHA